MNKVKRGVGIVLAVLLGAFMLPATPAYAADRQPLGEIYSVDVVPPSVFHQRFPAGVIDGSVSRSHGAPGAWVRTTQPPASEPGLVGAGVTVALSRVFPVGVEHYPPVEWQDPQFQAPAVVCSGGSVGGPAGYSYAERPASIDLSTISWLVDGLADGTFVWSHDWTGEPASEWNPNLNGMIWTPTEHGEELQLVNTLMGLPRERNFSLTFWSFEAFTPTWECNEPFVPETGHDRPAAVPDVGVVPVGATEVAVPVLDNDTLPNGAAQLVVTRDPSNGVAVARTSGADWDILYTPRVGFVGQDTFSYEVTDRFGEVTQADVVIDVLGEEPPVVEPPTEEPPPVEPPVVDPPVEEPPVVLPPAPTPAPVPDPVEPFFPATGDDGPDHVAVLQEVARTLAVPFGVWVLVVVGGFVVANRKGYI